MSALVDCLSRALGEIGQAADPRQCASLLVTRLREEFGGNNLYIPSLYFPARHARNAAIRRDYAAGVQINELSRRFNMTGQTIYSIVHGYRRTKKTS